MGFKCVPQIKGLVRGDGARRDKTGKNKHRANAKAIINEAFEIADKTDGHAIPIRKSASETYDRSRTVRNRYTGARTADGVMDLLEAELAKGVQVHMTDKKTGLPVIRTRAVASDIVFGIAVIYKPPCEVAKDWPKDKYDKFIRDSKEVMALLPCVKMNKKGQEVGERSYLFREENIIATAEHHDEGADPIHYRQEPEKPIFELHEHDIYLAKDQNGKYNGNLIDTYFLSRIVSANYPRMMRERGWDIEDCDLTDWERFQDDEGYKRERKTKIRKGGRTVNQYRADKKMEQADALLEEAQEQVESLIERTENVIRKEQEADAKVLEAEATRLAANDEKKKAEEARDEAIQQKDLAVTEKNQAVAAKDKAVTEREQEEVARDNISMERAIIQDSISFFQGIRNQTQEEITVLTKKKGSLATETKNAQDKLDGIKKEANDLKENMVAAAEQAAAAAARQERARIEKKIREEITKEAEADRDAAKAEAKQIRDNMIAKGQAAGRAAAQVERDRLIAEAKQEIETWRQQIKAKTEEKARRIIDDAKTTATGLAAFLMTYLDAEPFVYHKGQNAGKTYLDVAKARYLYEVRQARLQEHSDSTKTATEASRNQQTKDGKDITD